MQKFYDTRLAYYHSFCTKEVHRDISMADMEHVRVEVSKENTLYKVEVFLIDTPKQTPWTGWTCQIWKQGKEDPMNG